MTVPGDLGERFCCEALHRNPAPPAQEAWWLLQAYAYALLNANLTKGHPQVRAASVYADDKHIVNITVR